MQGQEVCLLGIKNAIQNIEKQVLDTSEFANPPLDLICGVCLGVMYKPSTLPCSHNFCANCLKTLLKKEDYIVCPFCRRHCPEIKRIDVNRKLADEIISELRPKPESEKIGSKEYVIEISSQHFKESMFGLEIKHFWEIKVKLANKRKHRSHQMIDSIQFIFSQAQDVVKSWGASHSIEIIKYAEPGTMCEIVITFASALKQVPLKVQIELCESEEVKRITSRVTLDCKHSELKPEKIASSKSVIIK